MRAAGAIFIGKTNTPEFGLGSHTFNDVHGATRNPYDPTRSAGGSSGGSAAALAARMLPVADGSDFGGSLRNPAAFCNVYGMRPSQGRVPRWPAVDVFMQQLGTEGPMGRTVGDVAQLLAIQAGYDANDPLSLAEQPSVFATPLDADLRGRRIAWVGDWDGYLATEPGVLAQCEQGLATLREIGCDVDAALPAFAPERIWRLWLAHRHLLAGGGLLAHYRDPARVRCSSPRRSTRSKGCLRWAARPCSTRASSAPRGIRPCCASSIATTSSRRPARRCSRSTSSCAGRRRSRAPDGHLSPLDGNGRAVDAGRLSGDQRAGRFQRRWIADGDATDRPAARDLAVLQLARGYEQAADWVGRRPPGWMAA
jgi:amidase